MDPWIADLYRELYPGFTAEEAEHEVLADSARRASLIADRWRDEHKRADAAWKSALANISGKKGGRRVDAQIAANKLGRALEAVTKELKKALAAERKAYDRLKQPDRAKCIENALDWTFSQASEIEPYAGRAGKFSKMNDYRRVAAANARNEPTTKLDWRAASVISPGLRDELWEEGYPIPDYRKVYDDEAAVPNDLPRAWSLFRHAVEIILKHDTAQRTIEEALHPGAYTKIIEDPDDDAKCEREYMTALSEALARVPPGKYILEVAVKPHREHVWQEFYIVRGKKRIQSDQDDVFGNKKDEKAEGTGPWDSRGADQVARYIRDEKGARDAIAVKLWVRLHNTVLALVANRGKGDYEDAKYGRQFRWVPAPVGSAEEIQSFIAYTGGRCGIEKCLEHVVDTARRAKINKLKLDGFTKKIAHQVSRILNGRQIVAKDALGHVAYDVGTAHKTRPPITLNIANDHAGDEAKISKNVEMLLLDMHVSEFFPILRKLLPTTRFKHIGECLAICEKERTVIVRERGKYATLTEWAKNIDFKGDISMKGGVLGVQFAKWRELEKFEDTPPDLAPYVAAAVMQPKTFHRHTDEKVRGLDLNQAYVSAPYFNPDAKKYEEKYGFPDARSATGVIPKDETILQYPGWTCVKIDLEKCHPYVKHLLGFETRHWLSNTRLRFWLDEKQVKVDEYIYSYVCAKTQHIKMPDYADKKIGRSMIGRLIAHRGTHQVYATSNGERLMIMKHLVAKGLCAKVTMVRREEVPEARMEAVMAQIGEVNLAPQEVPEPKNRDAKISHWVIEYDSKEPPRSCWHVYGAFLDYAAIAMESQLFRQDWSKVVAVKTDAIFVTGANTEAEAELVYEEVPVEKFDEFGVDLEECLRRRREGYEIVRGKGKWRRPLPGRPRRVEGFPGAIIGAAPGQWKPQDYKPSRKPGARPGEWIYATAGATRLGEPQVEPPKEGSTNLILKGPATLVEGPAGSGKTWKYILPALPKKRTLVLTHTVKAKKEFELAGWRSMTSALYCHLPASERPTADFFYCNEVGMWGVGFFETHFSKLLEEATVVMCGDRYQICGDHHYKSAFRYIEERADVVTTSGDVRSTDERTKRVKALIRGKTNAVALEILRKEGTRAIRLEEFLKEWTPQARVFISKNAPGRELEHMLATEHDRRFPDEKARVYFGCGAGRQRKGEEDYIDLDEDLPHGALYDYRTTFHRFQGITVPDPQSIYICDSNLGEWCAGAVYTAATRCEKISQLTVVLEAPR